MLEIAVQMDPLEKINFSSDSTFAMMLEAARRGHRLWFYTPDRLSLEDGQPKAFAHEISVRDQPGAYYTLGEARELDLAKLDVVLLRQDPPFDLAYITSTHFLERIAGRVLVVNDPAHVRNAPEKLFVTEFLDLMPPTLITRDKAAIERFRARHGEIVMKPLYGHGGASVFKVAERDPNFGSLFDLFSTTFREPWVVQRFLPQVLLGDKRILLVEGEALGAVNRVPAPDDIRSNMVRGGVASATELTEREREICRRLQPALVERGLLFVGIDVIDGWLTEINVTSPTGLRALVKHGGPDLSSTILDVIERRRDQQRASG
jgi:glutathione synthase